MNRLILVAAAMLVAVPANATTLLLPIQTVNASAPGTKTLSFSQFDATLGTLNSVVLSFTSSFSATGTLTNKANTAKNFAITPSVTTQLVGNGFSLLSTLASTPFTKTVGAKATSAIAPFGNSLTQSASLTAGLSPFIGTGTADFQFTSASSFASLPNSVMISILSTFGGQVSVAYDYTPKAPEPVASSVPEAGTWVMMFAGFGLAGFATRRRAAKAQLA